MLTNTKNSSYTKVFPISFDKVSWTKGFWADVFNSNADKTVPHLQKMFESKEISHVVENFKICAGDATGTFDGTNFGDGDFYKWMESAMYTAAYRKDKQLFQKLDEYIDLIGRAQLDDGYISTKQIMGERSANGISRLGDINDFEVYNFGHLFTAACLYKRLCGKSNFLKIAIKAATYLNQMYEENARTGEVQTAVCPSHYMGLLELYRTTNDPKHLALAKLAIELRDSVKDGTDDNQDRTPLKTHNKIVGHAVRSNYLYAGVADLYAELGDDEYLSMLHRVWKNLIEKKFYITGGCGALYNGTSPYGNFFHDQKVHQAYGYEYQLPNITAYNETCASLGLVFWAYRMFQIEPKAEYFDTIERAMLNVNLAAVSFSGNKFFYENMLRRAKKLDYELIWPLERSEYILSYCCPPNLARTIAQSAEYTYTTSADTVWFGMYGANEATFTLDCGSAFTLIQDTAYPYEGDIRISFKDVLNDTPFKMNIRIPKWSKNTIISINNTPVNISKDICGDYYTIAIDDPTNSIIHISFDMSVRRTASHPLVEENTNQVALERGPLVYCIESIDSSIDSLDDLFLDFTSSFHPISVQIEDRNVVALSGNALKIKRNNYNAEELYQTINLPSFESIPVTFIPYFAWDNRGMGEMKIFLPIVYQ